MQAWERVICPSFLTWIFVYFVRLSMWFKSVPRKQLFIIKMENTVNGFLLSLLLVLFYSSYETAAVTSANPLFILHSFVHKVQRSLEFCYQWVAFSFPNLSSDVLDRNNSSAGSSHNSPAKISTVTNSNVLPSDSSSPFTAIDELPTKWFTHPKTFSPMEKHTCTHLLDLSLSHTHMLDQ